VSPQVTLWEALNKSKRSDDVGTDDDEQILQQVLADSMGLEGGDGQLGSSGAVLEDDEDENYRLALEMSEREQQEAEHRRKEEEDELQRILELSLVEK